MKNLFLHNRFFYGIATCIILFVLSYSYPFLFRVAQAVLLLFIITCVIEWVILKNIGTKVSCSRKVLEKLSLGDEQIVHYAITNDSNYNIKTLLVDELPEQLQHRSYIVDQYIDKQSNVSKEFVIMPTERGAYEFGKMWMYISLKYPGFIQRREVIDTPYHSEVHPSIIQMRKYELQVFSKTAILAGIRQVRKIGENDEFEHIKPYQLGDNIKSINWKATSRKNQLMVNQYQNTRSQTVYCIVDKGRSMKMPFLGMTLLDHAVNSALVLSNIILKKYDKAGLITFSDKLGTIVRAKAMTGQLESISKQLYSQKTAFRESNFELLYYTCRQQINRRSILLFFTNFEQMVDLDRSLPYITRMGKKHLIVVILFINTEIVTASEAECLTKSDIYKKTFAEKALAEKMKIARTLNIHGIQTILTRPEDLSINVINKYLEIKNKRMS